MVSELVRPTGLVRAAVPEQDGAACLDIYAPFVRGTAVSFEEHVPSVEEFEQRIRATALGYPWLVFELDGQVVAYAYGSAHRSRAAYRWAADVSVYVAPTHHGSGIGRRLYTELLARLKGQGIAVACAGITLPNDASVGLHRAMGFQFVGVYKRIGWKAGAWHDVSWWQLELLPVSDSAPAEPRLND